VNRIKEIREKKNLMQKELAELAGISRPFLHDLENNRRGAKPETYQRIAEALGVTVAELNLTKAG
jgi:transcriptional regulator with XRE-family HTH domain